MNRKDWSLPYLLVRNSSIRKADSRGVELRIHGIVQGVGFRPFIYNLASQLNISGTVSNTSAGVLIQAVANGHDLESFISKIRSDAPPLAQILSIDQKPMSPAVIESSDFIIVQSEQGKNANTAIPPDIALCDDCLNELITPDDRRYGYPFINCTNCGPRFTIIETIPYDRPQTSMKVFPMCARCRTEYEDPNNRRFHAQPNACPDCGPQISWHNRKGEQLDCPSVVDAAIKAFNGDKVIAIRGLGGFHLAVNAMSEKAVNLLRQRKRRPTKPLAIMVKDLSAAQKLCHINEAEEKCLTSLEHPIVLLKKREHNGLAPNLCPGVTDVGIMLPYTPLHHLFFSRPDCPTALVMTSGNISGQPICISNQSALDQLSEIADNFILHNREILTRVDDSVTKDMGGAIRLFRRARGYSPSPLLLPLELPQTLGCGAGLKSTFCLSKGRLAFVSQHIGDLFNLESLDFYVESINHHRQVFEIEPEVVVRDMHPDYMSSHYAEEQKIPCIEVQHHHAHAVAVMAEHNLIKPTLAVILDGTGYGNDGTIWGGEILLADLRSFQRLAHLQQLPLPGGDKAAEEPWRMGISLLLNSYGKEGVRPPMLPEYLRTIDTGKTELLVEMITNGFNSPLTSSCGRLFDGIAALLGIRGFCDYEGHAAMELEAHAAEVLPGNWRDLLDGIMMDPSSPYLAQRETGWQINSCEFVKMVIDKTAKGFTVSQVALQFHMELTCAIAKLVTTLSAQHAIDRVVLSGGCMQNRLLMEGLFYTLEKAGIRVYTGAKVPVNDGGVSFGQTIIGGLHHVSCNSDAGN